MEKDQKYYFITLALTNVTVEDAGKYKITAKNELGESNATISLNFDSEYNVFGGETCVTLDSRGKCCCGISLTYEIGAFRIGLLGIFWSLLRVRSC